MAEEREEHVLIVGGGFGGLEAARRLGRSRGLRVTVVDRENHHLFQPLLYQVATAGLAPGDITMPIRSILRSQRRTRVLMGEVTAIDLERRVATLGSGETLEYDWLVVAAGAKTSWFGHEAWSQHAVGLKTLRDALTVRERVLMAFEEAEREPDPAKREALLTFVVIGAGPTGVEMAGAISELSRMTLRDDFRVVDPTSIRVILVEAADRVLTPFTPELSARAKDSLEELVVDVWIGRRVTGVGDGWIEVDGERVSASVVVWAAGVMPVSLGAALGVPTERGQIVVAQDCSLPGHPEAFAIGDIARFVPDGEDAPLPGLGAVAIQQGRYVAEVIAARTASGERGRFRYVDKGIMATIGRSRAVAQTSDFLLGGYTAWLAWLFVHLILLIGFRNRVAVLLSWFWSYITFRRGARLITRTIEPPGRTLEAELKREHALPERGESSLGAAEVRDDRA